MAKGISRPFFLEAEGAAAEAFSAEVLSCKGLPHVGRHTELGNRRVQAGVGAWGVAELDGWAVDQEGGVLGDHDCQIKRGRLEERRVPDRDLLAACEKNENGVDGGHFTSTQQGASWPVVIMTLLRPVESKTRALKFPRHIGHRCSGNRLASALSLT